MFDKFRSRKENSSNLESSSSFEIVLSKKFSLTVVRAASDSGRAYYIFKDRAEKQEFQIEESLFDAFRRAVAHALRQGDDGQAWYLSFASSSKAKFEFEQVKGGERTLHIIDLESAESRARLSLPQPLIGEFLASLFDAKFFNPSGVLNRVISYHKLLQLSFPQVSESLNAMMAFRADFLTIDIEKPRLVSSKGALQDTELASPPLSGTAARPKAAIQTRSADAPKDFVSRLGIKSKGTHSVNYDEFLSEILAKKTRLEVNAIDDADKKTVQGATLPGVVDLGFSALVLKSFRGGSLRIRPDEYDLQVLRDFCGSQKDNWNFFLGFEIVDCWYYDRNKKLRCKRFPLYFSEVALSDFGSEIEVNFETHASFSLNYLALSSLIWNFSRKSAAADHFEKTLERLLHSRFDWNNTTERILIERNFPVTEEFCKEQRRIIFGQESAGPLSGLLEDLKVLYVAIDPEQTIFFPRNSNEQASSRALTKDLDAIQRICQADSEAYFTSLFGKIFSPYSHFRRIPTEKSRLAEKTRSHGEIPQSLRFNPLPLPQSSEKIFDEVSKRDVLLVEGPPGTGKTHSMLGLVVNAVCQGQRVLVVSDKMSALEAVYEKMEAFVLEGVRDDVEMAARDFALKCGIKRVQLSEKANVKIQSAARELKDLLRLDLLQKKLPQSVFESAELIEDKLRALDQTLKQEQLNLDRLLASFFDRTGRFNRVCPRNWRETTEDDIDDFGGFARYLLLSPDLEKHELHRILKNFVVSRAKIISQSYAPLAAEFCPVEAEESVQHIQKLSRVREKLAAVLEYKPRDESTMRKLAEPFLGSVWHGYLMHCFLKAFGSGEIESRSGFTRIKDRLFYPLAEDLQNLIAIIEDDLELYSLQGLVRKRFASQLRKLHLFLVGSNDHEYSLAWNIVKSVLYGDEVASQKSVAESLTRIKSLQEERSHFVRKRYVKELLRPLQRISESSVRHRQQNDSLTDYVAQLDSYFEAAIQADNTENAWQSFEKAKASLHDLFHVWLVKKDCVSLALKNEPEMFDLVIIDEATQCRVDDAIPLFFRSKRIVAVGDDKQTVLQRESALDDYLFQGFDLENHLQTLNATGIKSAGSHVFGLVKGLKQSYVMLDEHYRCPPEIIEFSNRYVYGEQLRVMKWNPRRVPSAVVVDYSERRTRLRNRPTSGKYKGIEMGMIDRFFHFIERSILEFEKETGRRINLERDVAICYFLLKNSEYVKEQKQKFLARMKRGNDVLDGAGAALQGKERDLVFFLWDITRANFVAFAQGDDPLRRKGELNVLMSRPKMRAYHYLHKDFALLPHEKSSITSYLWDVWNRSHAKHPKIFPDTAAERHSLRTSLPSPFRLPWRRTDGQLIYKVLESFADHLGVATDFRKFEAEYGVPIGTNERRVDLILSPLKTSSQKSRLAFVEVIGFEGYANAVTVIEYYETLLRAQPAVTPVFLNIHELFSPGSPTLRWIFSLISEEFRQKVKGSIL